MLGEELTQKQAGGPISAAICPAFVLPCTLPGCCDNWCWDDDACGVVVGAGRCGNLCECMVCGCVLFNGDNPFMPNRTVLPPCALRIATRTGGGQCQPLDRSALDGSNSEPDSLRLWFGRTSGPHYSQARKLGEPLETPDAPVYCWPLCCCRHPLVAGSMERS